MKRFLKKHYGNIIFSVFIALLLIPQTRLPIMVFIQRLLAGAPKEISADKRETLMDYNWPIGQLNGGTINFSEAAGKVTLLSFWATWCPPCLAEMPSLQKLYDDYGKQVNFYCVSNENAAKLDAFINKKGYTLPVFLERTPAPAMLQTSSLPTTFIISKTGKIAMRTTGAANWNSGRVRQLLNTLLAENL